MDLTRERFQQIDRVFDAALDVPPHEREVFLARTCGSDDALRERVRTLLVAHDKSSGVLESAAASIAAEWLEEPSAAGARIPERAGPFRIVREIGAGGMGVVYLAERQDGEFQQRVALKLVRHAGASDAVRRRFLEERRILARLDHPRIAHLVDGGLTSDGQPYFAMEFVEGQPIDAWCRSRERTIDQRLALCLTVCEAVQYAHEHLVIHRDLKPSNILVRDDGQLKLLDFGIAKLLDPLGEADAGATETGVLALTPDYAAPEQVRGLPVSTATDTYALGVLLYQLLAGRRPYDARGRTPAEMERIICEVEPPRPSSVASEQDRRRLEGDLDVIVMKALHKDPGRRYPTASALAEDVRRFRTGLPVLARKDSVTYRTRKFVARNRTGVAASLVTVMALMGATAFSVAQAREAQTQRDAALQEVQRQRALGDMQDVMSGDPRDAEGRPMTPMQRIALAEQVLVQRFGGQPWLVVEGLEKLSARLVDLGEREAQLAMLARARRIAIDASLPTQLAMVECARAWTLVYNDHLDSARTSISAARKALSQVGRSTVLVTAMCLDVEGQLLVAEGHADSAVVLLRRAVDLSRGSAGAFRDQALNDLAEALRAVGRTREATTYQRLIILGLDSAGYRGSDVLPNMMTYHTSSLFELGELATVDSVMRAVREAQARLPNGHSSGLLQFLSGLAKLRLGDLDSAEIFMTRSMRDTTEGAGGLSVYLPPAVTQLRLEQRRLNDARTSLATLPTGTLVRRVNRAWFTARLRYAEGDVRGAPAMLEDSLRAITKAATQPPPSTAMPFVTAAEWRLAAGDAQGADSLALLARTAAAVDTLALARSAYVGRAELVRARALAASGNPREARLAADRAVVALANGYGPQHPFTKAGRALSDSLPAS